MPNIPEAWDEHNGLFSSFYTELEHPDKRGWTRAVSQDIVLSPPHHGLYRLASIQVGVDVQGFDIEHPFGDTNAPNKLVDVQPKLDIHYKFGVETRGSGIVVGVGFAPIQRTALAASLLPDGLRSEDLTPKSFSVGSHGDSRALEGPVGKSPALHGEAFAGEVLNRTGNLLRQLGPEFVKGLFIEESDIEPDDFL
jgi:hypothetical protein